MADVNSTQKLTATVKRKEVLIASAWNLFKTVMLYLGGVAVLAWLIWLGFYWGGSGCYTCTQNKPTVATIGTPPPPASSMQTTETATLTEIEKDLSAIEKILLEQRETAQASASATTAAVVVPPPPKAERRAPVTKQTEPLCPCPSQGKTILEQGPAVPMPILSSVERRRNEMWSALRR